MLIQSADKLLKIVGLVGFFLVGWGFLLSDKMGQNSSKSWTPEVTKSCESTDFSEFES